MLKIKTCWIWGLGQGTKSKDLFDAEYCSQYGEDQLHTGKGDDSGIQPIICPQTTHRTKKSNKLSMLLTFFSYFLCLQPYPLEKTKEQSSNAMFL